jgi:hypothetical protein
LREEHNSCAFVSVREFFPLIVYTTMPTTCSALKLLPFPTHVVLVGVALCIVLYMYYLFSEMRRIDARLTVKSIESAKATERLSQQLQQLQQDVASAASAASAASGASGANSLASMIPLFLSGGMSPASMMVNMYGGGIDDEDEDDDWGDDE